MEIFRITKARWAETLTASGFSGRWNSHGIKIIYAAASRSLACLENLVHRGETGHESEFRTMVIYVPDRIAVHQLFLQELPEGWELTDTLAMYRCQCLGDQWVRNKISPVLKVPSAIIKNEFNFLLNPVHPDFDQIKIIDHEPFYFDSRLD